MHVETLDLWTEYLRAELPGAVAAAPIRPGDERPVLAARNVLSELDDDRCATVEEPAEVPAVYVTTDVPASADGDVSRGAAVRDYRIEVTCRVIVARGTTVTPSVREAMYLLRAMTRVLTAFMYLPQDARERDGVIIRRADDVLFGRWFEEMGDVGAVQAALVIPFVVRDCSP